MCWPALPQWLLSGADGESGIDMNLPANTQPGEQLDLSVVKNQPRLTFAFTRDLQ